MHVYMLASLDLNHSQILLVASYMCAQILCTSILLLVYGHSPGIILGPT